jgi:D-alanyl-D-alanine carboxypeptidase
MNWARFAGILLLLLATNAMAASAARSNGSTKPAPGFGGCPRPSLPPNSDAIDRMVLDEMNAKHVPGGSIVVVENGHVKKVRAYGYADLESCVPATDRTLFGIGSISKQFTAAGALTLVRDGVLSLEDPITKFLPEGKGAWDGVTVRQLLTHTSGIPDYCGDDSKFPSITLDRASAPSTEELLRQIAKVPLNFRPGDDWAYSNTGFLVLSALVERASKQPFPKFMQEHVFAPLGMSSTRYYSPTELISGRATPYHVGSDGAVTHGPFISDQFSRWGDMGMLSSADDMARWITALGRDRLLPANLWREMLTPVRLNDGARFPYGFGIGLDDIGDEPLWSHSGTFRVGYSAELLSFPQRQVGVAVLSNHWGEVFAAGQVAQTVLGAIAPDLAPLAMRQAHSDPQPAVTAALARFLKGDAAAEGAAGMTAFFARHDDIHKRLAEALSSSHRNFILRFVECRRANQEIASAMRSPVTRQCSYQLDGAAGLPSGLVFWLTQGNDVAGLTPW